MYVYNFKDKEKNFGDDLNDWLWDALLPDAFDGQKDSWMSGIGSIINDKMPEGKKKLIFSSGAGYGFLPKHVGSKDWNIISVRGPLTAEVLGLSEDSAVTDGALLLSFLPEFSPLPDSSRNGIIFIPHHACLDYSAWKDVCKKAGIEFLSPREDSRKVIKRIRSAKLVLGDAMHAAIVADTLRVPWIPVSATPGLNIFKWRDWTTSLELPYNPVYLPSSNLPEEIEKFSMNLFGGFYPQGNTNEESLEEFKKKFINNSPISRFLDRKLRRLLSKPLRTIAVFMSGTNFILNINMKYQERAAKALKQAASEQPYLSDNGVYERKRSELKRRLDVVNNILQGN